MSKKKEAKIQVNFLSNMDASDTMDEDGEDEVGKHD